MQSRSDQFALVTAFPLLFFAWSKNLIPQESVVYFNKMCLHHHCRFALPIGFLLKKSSSRIQIVHDGEYENNFLQEEMVLKIIDN